MCRLGVVTRILFISPTSYHAIYPQFDLESLNSTEFLLSPLSESAAFYLQ
ncbi:hypothetical protein LY16_03165 [Xenorhabdus doucetiae]|uniref:Transposase n=1 Tax=Xenorhabdus doucetiae TaxID=351671 RepID=A0ABY3NMZ2_9GAMM|nr:hypothetical protein LY16_03165 [Xenorhabdus doucetiae]